MPPARQVPSASLFEALEPRQLLSGPEEVDPPLPRMTVRGGAAVEIANQDSSPRTADGTGFGLVKNNDPAVRHTFTIQNTGTADLVLGESVEIRGGDNRDFKLTRAPASVVAPGESTTFEIRFEPLGRGARRAEVLIETNDPIAGGFTFAVRGAGRNPAHMIVYFDSDPVPGDNEATYRIANIGKRTLRITSSRLSEFENPFPFGSHFSMVRAPSKRILPGRSATFVVSIGGFGFGLLSFDSNTSLEAVTRYRVNTRGELSPYF